MAKKTTIEELNQRLSDLKAKEQYWQNLGNSQNSQQQLQIVLQQIQQLEQEINQLKQQGLP
jgi:hypothetical protein